MKIKSIIAVLLLAIAGMQHAIAQKMVVTMTDNQVVKYDISKVKHVTFEETDDHEWVDLGLPSRTLWATCNVGAEKPEEYGDYFAWGEITGYKGGKKYFSWGTYIYCKNDMAALTKYCTDGATFGYNGFTDAKTELDPEDDAATVNWGNGWQMPSWEQWMELLDGRYTTSEMITVNGIRGWKLTSNSNGNSIFLPVAGCCDGMNLCDAGSYGSYWSRTLSSSNNPYAYMVDFWIHGIGGGLVDTDRYVGRSVRPVRSASGSQHNDPDPQPDDHAEVDLGLPSGTLWAACNVGANSPEEYGDYFAWGETEGYMSGKKIFDWSTYKYCMGSISTLTKYCSDSNYGYNGFTDNKTELDPEDDAATVNWGQDWQIPSDAQQKELVNSNYTTIEWTTLNNVFGIKVTSNTNGNHIFLPAAGTVYGVVANPPAGFYMSRTSHGGYAVLSLYFHSDSIGRGSGYRSNARSVRPVRKQPK